MRKKKLYKYSIKYKGAEFKTTAYSRMQAVFKIFVNTYGNIKDAKIKKRIWNSLKRTARVNWKMPMNKLKVVR